MPVWRAVRMAVGEISTPPPMIHPCPSIGLASPNLSSSGLATGLPACFASIPPTPAATPAAPTATRPRRPKNLLLVYARFRVGFRTWGANVGYREGSGCGNEISGASGGGDSDSIRGWTALIVPGFCRGDKKAASFCGGAAGGGNARLFFSEAVKEAGQAVRGPGEGPAAG